MKHTVLSTLACFCLCLPPSLAVAADPTPQTRIPAAQEAPLDPSKTGRGVKDILASASDRAVRAVAKPDGYFGNPNIRINMPGELEHLPPYFREQEFQTKVNAFILSLNRAAEKAAPKASGIITVSIRDMTIDDEKKILSGGDTAATDYFRAKNYERLAKEFRPAVISGMNEAGVTAAYRELMEKYDYESVALFPVDDWSFDMDGYLTGKALDGLFFMMGEEEKKIKKDRQP